MGITRTKQTKSIELRVCSIVNKYKLKNIIRVDCFKLGRSIYLHVYFNESVCGWIVERLIRHGWNFNRITDQHNDTILMSFGKDVDAL